MLLQPRLMRIALAIILLAAPFKIAQAQSNPNDELDKLCHMWGGELKAAAKAGSEDARASAIKSANASLETNLLQVNIPGGDDNFKSATSHLRTCLEKDAIAAFGSGTSVAAKLGQTIVKPPAQNGGIKVIPSAQITATIEVSPGSKVVATGSSGSSSSSGSTVVPIALQQAFGKQLGDSCLSKGDRSCCAAADRFKGDCKSKDNCKVSVKICETMVSCDLAQNDCRKKTMNPKCDNDACKKCVADYKSCHDAALRISN